MKAVLIKEVKGKDPEAFTALTDLLKSEGLFHLYMVIYRNLLRNVSFTIKDVTITVIDNPEIITTEIVKYKGKRIAINHTKHKHKTKQS